MVASRWSRGLYDTTFTEENTLGTETTPGAELAVGDTVTEDVEVTGTGAVVRVAKGGDVGFTVVGAAVGITTGAAVTGLGVVGAVVGVATGAAVEGLRVFGVGDDVGEAVACVGAGVVVHVLPE